MRLIFEIGERRRRIAPPVPRNASVPSVGQKQLPSLVPIPGDRGTWWHRIIGEPFTGAWQRNIEYRTEDVLSFHAVYACVTLIASDIAKLRVKLVEQVNGLWQEVDRNSPFVPVLRKPNNYQTRIKFYQQWMMSKLMNGNTYVLKERDQRRVVVALHILDPNRTKVLQAPNGDVYYELNPDALSGVSNDPAIGTRVVVPAMEIIHDHMPALYHPLCGVSPLTACYAAAASGISMQNNSIKFFSNSARPGGVLTAPGYINNDTAQRLKDHFETNFTGEHVGKIAVLGDGLRFESMMMNAVDAELIRQLELSGKMVCSAFHVPAYKVGIEAPPSYNNIGALNQQYYDQCLQTHIEDIELLLDEGLGLTDVDDHIYGTEFDLDGLLRMDPATQMDVLTKAIGGTVLTPNEAREKIDRPALTGGDTVYMQQQNYSLAALAERDKMNPLAPQPVAQPAQPQPPVNLTVNTTTEKAAPSALPAPQSPEEIELEAQAAAQIAMWKVQSEFGCLLDDAA